MKKHLATLILLLVSGFGLVNGQNLDQNKLSYTYTRMPLVKLPLEVTSYWVNVNLTYLQRSDNKSTARKQWLNVAKIDHLTKTDNEGLEIFIRQDPYYRGDLERVETTKKEKRGDEEISVKYYHYEFPYKYPVYYEIKLPGEDSPIQSGHLYGSKNKKTYISESFKSTSTLYKWWRDNGSKVEYDLRQNIVNSTRKDLSRILADRYDFREVSTRMHFVTVKKFKKHNYDDIDEALTYAQDAVNKIQAEDVVFNDEFRELMQQAITTWETTLAESNPDDKKSRINKKISKALYENIYKAYTMMDEFDRAKVIKEESEGKIKNAISSNAESLLEDKKKRYEANIERISK